MSVSGAAAFAVLIGFGGPSAVAAGDLQWGTPVDVGATTGLLACPSTAQCTAIGGPREVTFNPVSPGARAAVFVDRTGSAVGVACPSTTQCTFVNGNGSELTFDPASPGTPAAVAIDSNFQSVACPSTTQCTAVDSDGREVTFDPASPGTPTPVTIDGNDGLGSVACPSTTQCTVLDIIGREVTFDPASPGSPTPVSLGGGNSVACPSTTQCTVVDESGHELTFNPASPGTPTPSPIDTGNFFRSVACPSTTQCTAVDDGGGEVTFDPASPGTPTRIAIDKTLFDVACPSTTQCTAADAQGNEITGTADGPTMTLASGPPMVSAASASGVSATSAMVTIEVNAESSPTVVRLQYGLDPSLTQAGGKAVVYTGQTPPQTIAPDGAPNSITAMLTGLVPNATYHVRAVASNSDGTTTGPDRSFMTAATPTPPAPVLGKNVDMAVTAGRVFIKLPPGATLSDTSTTRATDSQAVGTGGFIPLTEARQIPVGSIVDTTRGTVSITAATSERSRHYAGRFTAGVFKLLQARRQRGLTTLELMDTLARAKVCAMIGKGRRASTARALPSKVLGELKSTDHGKFSTRGDYSAATVRGTAYSVTDTCAGTLTRVTRGVVAVDYFHRHQTVVLHAGQSVLALASGATTQVKATRLARRS